MDGRRASSTNSVRDRRRRATLPGRIVGPWPDIRWAGTAGYCSA